jgi:hypothetical protein
LFWIALALASNLFSEAKKTSLRELTATIFSLIFFAGVGLIAQVFNVKSGNYFGLVALWCASMLPLTLTMRSWFLPAFWLLALLSLPSMYLVSTQLPISEAQKISYSAMAALIWLLASFLPLCRTNTILNPQIARAWQSISLYALTAGISIFGFFMWGKSIELKFWLSNDSSAKLFSKSCLIAAFGLCIVALVLAAKKSKHWASDSAVILSAALVLAVPILWTPPLFSSLFSFVGSLIPILAGLYFSIKMRMIREFRTFCSLIALRVLIAYFEVLGSLATTAFGLILFGLLVIAGVSFGRKHLFKYNFQEE